MKQELQDAFYAYGEVAEVKLLKERRTFERARAHAKERRHMRKQVLMRTSKNWPENVQSSVLTSLSPR